MLHSSLKCRTDRLVVKAQTPSVSSWHLLSSAASPRQFNGNEPCLSFLVSTLSWSEELCLFLSIFSLYLQCSSYRGKKSLSLYKMFSSSVSLPHVSLFLSYHLLLILTSFTHSLVFMPVSPLVSQFLLQAARYHRSSSQTERFNTLSIGGSSPQTATCSINMHTCTQTVYYCVRLERQQRRG